MSAGAPKPAPEKPDSPAPPPAPTGRMLLMEAEILDELRRVNKLLTGMTAGPRRYTLAFLSGIARGLGAALGATVLFAIFLAILGRLNTVPLIGGYLKGVIEFIEHSSPGRHRLLPSEDEPSATPTPVPAGSPAH